MLQACTSIERWVRLMGTIQCGLFTTCIAWSSREASAECQENDPRREQAGMETMEVICVSCHITPGKIFWGFP